MRDRPTGSPVRVQIGIADVVPKNLAFRLAGPLLVGPDRARVVVHEDDHDRLLAALAMFQLDLVIADSPIGAGSRVKAFHHSLGRRRSACSRARAIARARCAAFPESLRGQRFVLPLEDNRLRRGFDAWLRACGLQVDVVAEVEDDALARPLARSRPRAAAGADGAGRRPRAAPRAREGRRRARRRRQLLRGHRRAPRRRQPRRRAPARRRAQGCSVEPRLSLG